MSNNKSLSNSKIEKVSQWYSSYSGLNNFMITCVFRDIKHHINEPLLEVGAADGWRGDAGSKA